MLYDARFALRMFTRRPGVALLIVLTLAIGIAASTTVFTLADAILWHPVPFRDPERLVHLRGYVPSQPNQMSVPVAAIEAWLARGRVVSAVYPWAMASAVIGGDEDAEETTVAKLSAGLISELGARMRLGRDFEAADAERRVAIIGDDCWRTRFRASSDVVGQSIRIDGEAHTVIGVMPAGFEFPVSRIEVWLPYTPPAPPARVRAIARLRADLTFDQAASLVQSTTKGFREQRQLPELRVVPLVNVNVSTSKAIYIMLAGVVCVLLIAIANAANLLLGDMVQRRAELAVRRSLGASRLVLARQLLVETLLRSSLAAIAALLLARWALHAIVDGVPYLMSSGSLVLIALAFGMPLALAAARGLRSLLYEVSPTDPATLTTVVAGLVIAALAATYLPARRASRVDPSEALRYE